MARYTITTLPAGATSITVTPAGFGGTSLTFRKGDTFDDSSGAVLTALTAASVTTRALSATAGTQGAGNRDTLGENVGVSNASP